MRPSERAGARALAALLVVATASLALGAAATSQNVARGDRGGDRAASGDALAAPVSRSADGGSPGGGAESTRSEAHRALLQFSGGCAPGRSGPVDSADSDDLCSDCAVGTFASGREAYCIFPDVDVTCKPTFDSAVSGWSDILDPEFGAFTAALTLAAHCDFAKDAPALVSGDAAQCHFAQLGQLSANPTTCTPSVTVDADGVSTNLFVCDIDSGDAVDAAIFETCMDQGLTTGATVRCVWGGDQTACATCPAGSLCSAAATIEPPPCPQGEACPDGATSQTCAAGTYAGGGFEACMNCPNGTQCPDAGTGTPTLCPSTTYSGTAATSCEACWAGYFCGGQGVQWPVPCDPGSYSAASSDSCSLCDPGYTSAASAETCTACPEGTMCPNSGTAEAVPCDAGTSAAAGSALCAACDVGTYQPDAQQSSCLDCPAGTSCAYTGMEAYTSCWEGSYSGWVLVDEEVAFALPYDETDASRFPTAATAGSTECASCPAGYTCETAASMPVLCPAGNTRLVTSGNWTHCMTCPAGFSCATPNVDPSPCDAGAYATGGAATCTPCDAGYYCPYADQNVRLRCASGYYALGGNATCSVCPAGTACPNADGTEMEVCVSGSFAEAGSTQCTPCPPGFACPSTTKSSDMSACAAGTYAVGGAAACEACPAGTFGPDAGAYALDACVTCPAGTFSNATAATSDATCLACPEDTYCDVAGATAPTACPAGTGTFGATARDDPDACARPSPPPPPPSPPPVPSSPPPPPLPPALAAGADATPTMTLRLEGDPAAFDEAAFKTGVAAAAGGGAVAADVVVEAVRSGSVVVDFYVAVPNVLFPVSLGGAWDVQELSRVVETLNAAIAGGTLNVGAPVLSAALEAHCSPGSRVAAEIGAAGTLVCEICGVGTFSATRDAETCAPCAVGYAAGARGMTECEICAPGSVAAAAGTAVCEQCAAGTVAPAAGSASCAACDDFFFAADAGSTQCEACPPGFLSGPSAWSLETARMRADGALSAEVRAAVDRAGCVANETRFAFFAAPASADASALAWTHAAAAAATLLATVGGMCWLGHAHWSRQRLLVKYAGGETFYEEMLVASGGAGEGGADKKRGGPGGSSEDFDAATACLKAGALEDAERALDAVLARDPKHARAWHAKAVVHLLYGELVDARAVAEKAAKHFKPGADTKNKAHLDVTIGATLVREGDFAGAALAYESAVRRDSTLAVAHYNLGLVRFRLDDHESAKDAFVRALEKEPGYYKAMYALGLCEAETGRASDAKRWFKASTSVRRRAMDAHFNLGMLYAREGDVKEAELCFGRCLAVHAKHAPSIVKLGNLLLNRGLPKRAVEKYLLALELDPDNVEAIANIGVVEWSQTHALEAEQHFLLALKFDKTYFPAIYNLGLLCAEQGRVEEAAVWYRRGLASNPSRRNRDALFRLGVALRRLGELEGESPRRVEKTAREREVEAEEAAREAEEADARAQEAIAAELRGEVDGRTLRREARAVDAAAAAVGAEPSRRRSTPIPSGPARDATDRRRWQRLVLLSDAVKGADSMRRCALPDVGVVTYDHEHASAHDILRLCVCKLADADGVKKVDSVAVVAPCGDGSVSVTSELILSSDSLLEADVAAFVRGLVSLLETGSNAFRRGSRLDFPLLDASAERGAALAEETRKTFGVATVNASDDITRRETYAVTDEFMATAPAAAGLRAAADYFDLGKLEKWAAAPNARAAHPPPPEERDADPVTRRTVSVAGPSSEESAAEADAKAVAANAARRLQTVGRTYAAYFRARAVAEGDVKGGEGADVDAAEAAATASERDALRDDASVSAVASDDDGSPSAGAFSAGISSSAARALAGIHAPASAVLAAAKFKGQVPKSALKKPNRDKYVAAASTASRALARKALSLDLLVEMPPAEFKQQSAQAYFASSLASELGARADRFRVTAYDETTGAATVRVDEAPGDVSFDELVTSLRSKIDADALLIDPAFGSVVLAQIIWPEGWADGAPPKAVESRKSHAEDDERRDERLTSLSASVSGSDGEGGETEASRERRENAATSSAPPTRLVLVSSRVRFADALLSSARDGVVAVYFDWRFGSLQALAHDCAAACFASAPDFRGLRSIGVVTHHKPGAVGLVKGLRLTSRNLARGELRQFWLAVAKLLRPDGRVEMLAYDASACAPTRRLLEELEDLMRAPARAVDAAAAAAAGVVDADDFEDADDEDAPGPKNPASAYFRPRRFHAWALAAPEKYTLGAEKYRVSQGQGAGVAEKLRVTTPDDDLTNVAARDPYRNAAGLAVSGDAHSPSATTDVVALDPEVDEETALIVQRARAAKVRALADAARRRAMSRNPADVLRSTTRAGGDHAFDPMTLRSYDSGRASSETRDRGSSEKPVVTRAALDRFALDVVSASPVFDADAARAKTRKLVPRLPAEALAAARDDAAAYDARLDARAAETRARAARRALMSDAALDAEERAARHEARVEDLSLVPTLALEKPGREGRKTVRSRFDADAFGARTEERKSLAPVSPNLRRASETNVYAFDGLAAPFGDDASANDAPDAARVVDAHAIGSVTTARPQWDADRHLEKLRRYENTGL